MVFSTFLQGRHLGGMGGATAPDAKFKGYLAAAPHPQRARLPTPPSLTGAQQAPLLPPTLSGGGQAVERCRAFTAPQCSAAHPPPKKGGGSSGSSPPNSHRSAWPLPPALCSEFRGGAPEGVGVPTAWAWTSSLCHCIPALRYICDPLDGPHCLSSEENE